MGGSMVNVLIFFILPVVVGILAALVSNLILVRLPREFGAKVGVGNLYASYLLTVALVVTIVFMALDYLGSETSDAAGIVAGVLLIYDAPIALVVGIVFAVKLGKKKTS
jgi:hypothetical protein